MMITYGIYDSPIGDMVIGQTEKGLCWIGFSKEDKSYAALVHNRVDGVERMKQMFADAHFERDDASARRMGEMVLTAWEADKASAITMDVQGTDFQKKVRARLGAIGKGETKTYSDIANEIGEPDAARAVGTAVGTNPLSLLVPCHRVVPKSGGVGEYLWGSEMKAELLAAERQDWDVARKKRYDLNKHIVAPLTKIFEKAGYHFTAEAYDASQERLLDCRISKDKVSYAFTVAVREYRGIVARLLKPAPASLSLTRDDEVYKNSLTFEFDAFNKADDKTQRPHDLKNFSNAVIERFRHLDMTTS